MGLVRFPFGVALGEGVQTRMMKKLRSVVAVSLVALVALFGATGPASANPGPWTTVEISHPSSSMTPDIDGVQCAFSLQHGGAGSYSINIGTGYCIGLPDVSWGYAQDGEAGSAFAISVTGLTAGGSSCSGADNSTFAPHPRNGTITVAGTVTSGTLSVGATDCSITQVCMSLRGSQPACVAADIPAVTDGPVAGVGCPVGTPSAHLTARKAGDLSGYYSDEIVLNVTLPTGVSTAAWGYVVHNVLGGGVGATGRVLNNEIVIKSTGQHAAIPAPPPTVPAGARIQLYAFPVAAPNDWNKSPQAGQGPTSGVTGDGNAYTLAQSIPTSGGTNEFFHGLTMPDQCRFYFGPKVVNFAGTELDEPQGDGVGPVLPPEPEVYPEPVLDEPEPVDEPPTDDLGWLALIWALVNDIWNAISDWSGVLRDLFVALLVPSIDSWIIGDFVDLLENKPPFSVADELLEQGEDFAAAYQGAGSCGVLADFGNGRALTCSAIRNAPGMGGLYNLVSAGLIATTAWGAVQIVRRTFEASS